MSLGILILAGGLGKRMNSYLPKVLHKLKDKTLIQCVIETANTLNPDKIGIIVGKYKDQIEQSIQDTIEESILSKIEYIIQEEAKGTGHAVQCATGFIKNYNKTLVLSGDVPLITEKTLKSIINLDSKCTILVNELENPTGYGRIKRLESNESNEKVKIIEEKDCTEEEKLIKEINSGIYCFEKNSLLEYLPKLECSNAQNEYYLTDVVSFYNNVKVIKSDNNDEILGVNTSEQLEQLEQSEQLIKIDELRKQTILINNKYLVGVVGLGFVGSSIYKSLDLKGCQIKGYDKDKTKSYNNFEDLLGCNILFLCLPTIYNEELKQYDKSCINETCSILEQNNYSGIIIIKSTVEPKTTEELCKKFKTLRFIHNPEFLTAATAFYDFHNQTHIIIGKSINCTNNDVEYLKNFYDRYYSGTEISICTSNESECMKSFVNCFYSVKIQFFNELYLLCQKIGADYGTIKKLMLRNGWINHMHTQVPGTDGKLSYGGYCFPKDTNALLEYMKIMDSPREVLEATISERNKMRDDFDNYKFKNDVKLNYNSLEDKSILITGGAGFIGSNIVESLLSQNVKYIRIVDNLVTGKMENIKFLLDKYNNLEFMYGDISNIDTCRKAVKNIDIISHQAALGSVPRSVNDPLSSHDSNVNGFLNILIAAKEEGIKRIVYASSSSVYGDHPKLPKVEDNTGNVLSPYAATKAIDEIYAGVFTKCYGMECIGFRYFNVFGPRQDPNGAYAAVIPKFIKLMKEGKSPTINGDGSFSRDFTYVENVVQANILGMSIDNEKCYGEAFNIGAGGQYSLLQLVETLNKELKTDIEPIFGPNRTGDIPHSNADISKAKKILGYNPNINFYYGIYKLVNYNKSILIKNLQYSQLLNREEINIDNISELKYLNNKTILVTGGYGSIGSEIVRQLLNYNVKIIIYDNNECNYFYLQNELKYKKCNIEYILGCINDVEKLESVFLNNNVDVIYHVAAYKHVPILEENIYEAIKINVIGTKNIADLSLKHNIKKFIFISTDKAVNPSNVMGASKRTSEMYINYLWNKYKTTQFIITRFGNVLGSSGSVLPIFINNINNNFNLQLTDINITRYFMTIPEAAKLVLLSSCICENNNTVLFNMGEPIKLYDLAKNLLKMLKREDLSIDIIGLRPGEKLHEELYYKNEIVLNTKYDKILLLKSNIIDNENFIENYNKLIQVKNNDLNIKELLKKIVSDYNYK